ncbi:1134a32d-13f8-41c2-a24f-4eb5a922095f [Sclerotinia trifoliorum]|uniref:1134a32d-13f8-41c2-a24f-4eb5a922095f n=1 Tax=Sclerotinia trifoliorum TaxID=28548 RepID=A0A8H2VRG9_9HELO|nr:1134a32d-13f8-41c2-a24f-4eb5a922095f [Sclerotinia trifoliorum]
MFGNFASFAPLPTTPDGKPRIIPPPTPLTFPSSTPQSPDYIPPGDIPLVTFLQTIHRPADIKLSHFEKLGVHIIPDASPQDFLPDPSFLPPVQEWTNIPEEHLEDATTASRRLLSNGNQGPGVKNYLDRRRELFIDNTAAFRTVRRLPQTKGTPAARLGNAYEFYKNLEVFSSYWVDTSLPKETAPSPTTTGNDAEKQTEEPKEAEDKVPIYQQTHVRTGTGSQLPHEFRQGITTAFIKLIAYDFGCNVSFPRVEPRLHIHSPPSQSSTPPSNFSAMGVTMLYRTPTDRNSARAGFLEGPLAALSCRSTTSFTTPLDSNLDLAREIITILLTAQQRNREGKTEKLFGAEKWWTTAPRWGGGKGGPIGKEIETTQSNSSPAPTSSQDKSFMSEIKSKIGGINSFPSLPSLPSAPFPQSITPERRPPQKKPRTTRLSGPSQLYENYRKMMPPASTWDKKVRYMTIGKPGGVQGNGDEIFLVSSLNHHVSFLRGRVGKGILEVLDGEKDGSDGFERTTVWRTRWYDLFLGEDRVEAMGVVWGIMAWIMRAEEGVNGNVEGGGQGGMDVDRWVD